MNKIKSTINLLKTMLNTSYDTSSFIDQTTKKINKKSVKVWLLIVICFLVLYLSNYLISALKNVGAETLFLSVFFLLLQMLVIFQTILLGINIMYFSEDIENYLHLPISNMKLQFTKFSIVMSVIFGTELILVVPSLYVYGVQISQNILLYHILVILVLFLISIFLSTMVLILMIPIIRIFRFIKKQYWYQSIVVLVMTTIMLSPMVMSLFHENNNGEQNYYEQNINQEELNLVIDNIYQRNKYYKISQIGIEALKECNSNSIINILKLTILDIIVICIYFIIGKITYIEDVLFCLSIVDKRKRKKINLEKRCKLRSPKIAFIKNDIADILKNPTFFMHYIYNVFIILSIIITISITIIPTIKQSIIDNTDISNTFKFEFDSFSIIVGIIQLVFTIAPMSLTAISRYGKNAIIFKYIPIQLTTQFRMKNIPQIMMGTIIIIAILATVHWLFPEISLIYLLGIFVISMLLNTIYSYILFFIDLKRPQLNNENDISVLQQNENNLFKYIVTAILCVLLWYLYQVTKELNINTAIIIEIIVCIAIVIILEFIINKKKYKLYDRIF